MAVLDHPLYGHEFEHTPWAGDGQGSLVCWNPWGFKELDMTERLNWTVNFQMFKMDLEKAEEPRSNCQHLLDHRKSKRIPEKHLLLLYWLQYDCVDSHKLWKILKEVVIPDYLTCLLRNLYAGQEATVRILHETADWFKLEKGVCQSCILSPCIFNLNSDILGWMSHKLESRLLGEISTTSDMQMIPPSWHKAKRN